GRRGRTRKDGVAQENQGTRHDDENRKGLSCIELRVRNAHGGLAAEPRSGPGLLQALVGRPPGRWRGRENCEPVDDIAKLLQERGIRPLRIFEAYVKVSLQRLIFGSHDQENEIPLIERLRKRRLPEVGPAA